MTSKYTVLIGGVRDNETNGFIPDDLGNTKWQEYQLWLGAGNTPQNFILDEFKRQKLTRARAVCENYCAGKVSVNSVLYESEPHQLFQLYMAKVAKDAGSEIIKKFINNITDISGL